MMYTPPAPPSFGRPTAPSADEANRHPLAASARAHLNSNPTTNEVLGNFHEALQVNSRDMYIAQRQLQQLHYDLQQTNDYRLYENIDMQTQIIDCQQLDRQTLEDQQRALSSGEITPRQAQEMTKELTHAYEPSSSKYEKVHVIGLNAGPISDKQMDLETELYAIHSQDKGVPLTYDGIDVSGQGFNSPNLNSILSSIPVDDDTRSPNAKPIKISLLAHGEVGSLYINSPIMGGVRVTGEQVASLLREHLEPGDYNNKLTIALKPCFAGEGSEYQPSTMDRMADQLSSEGYASINITGSDRVMAINRVSNQAARIGSDVILNDDGEVEKFSKSNAKQRRSI